MDTTDGLDEMVRDLDDELEGEFEKRLRAELDGKDRAWLIDNLVEHFHRELHLDNNSQRQLQRRAEHVEPVAVRRERLRRIRALELDDGKLRDSLGRYRALGRETLVTEGFLLDPPHKGKEALGPDHRSAEGEVLLQEVRDLFYALLFGDSKIGVNLTRDRRDFLTVTLPTSKAPALERFLLAVTEFQVSGTWLDPDGVSDDIGAPNTILQVEFGDSADELISEALLVVLGMLNNLEVNEQILYGRIEEVERSTLVG